MKTPAILLLLIGALGATATAQDTYHTNLQSSLQTDYGLPAGNWVFHDSEVANYNADYTWGNATATTQTATGQDFSQKVLLTVSAPGSPQWASGYGIQNVNSIAGGSACLFVIWLRAANNGSGQVSLFIENTSTYEKETYLTINVTADWVQYLIPFEANQTYAAAGLSAGMHVAWQAQEIEIGGLAMLDYGTSVSVDDLPNQVNNDHYGGWEPDAPWRAEAAQRIEEIRKANLTVRVEDASGNPLPDVPVQVEMLQHDFAFGSAVVASRFAGNQNQNDTYESKLLDLDGQGHGFNWVVFENALKWPAWEQNWIATKAGTANATQWLHDHDIKVRGHNLVWPGLNHLPADVAANASDATFVKNRIFGHIEEIATWPGIAGNIAEWDVLNEITTNRALEYALQGQPGYPTGREIYPEIFNKLAEVDPDTKTWLNDYVTISQGNTGGGLYDDFKQFTQEIVDAGVPLDGIGFQAHIGGFPTSIYDVKDILDDYYTTFGTAAKVTEYDISSEVSDELAATYLRDFLTMIFSHPSMDGFLMWGFWDGAHWKNNAPLFYQDWTLKPSGQTFTGMVFNEWWTTENGQTDTAGEFLVRGFKGKYKVTVTCPDTVLVDTVQLPGDLLLVKMCDVVNAAGEASPKTGMRVFPNLVDESFTVQFDLEKPQPVALALFNTQGVALKKMAQPAVFKDTMPVDMAGFSPGMYLLQIRTVARIRVFKIAKL